MNRGEEKDVGDIEVKKNPKGEQKQSPKKNDCAEKRKECCPVWTLWKQRIFAGVLMAIIAFFLYENLFGGEEDLEFTPLKLENDWKTDVRPHNCDGTGKCHDTHFAPPGFYVRNGIVYLEGFVGMGKLTTKPFKMEDAIAITTLPPRYRPKYLMHFGVSGSMKTNVGWGGLRIWPSGVVDVYGKYTGGWISFGGVHFRMNQD